MSARANLSGQHMPATPFDILAEELGAAAGRIERESLLRIEAAVSEVRRIDAERELRFTQLERRVEDAIGRVKDGAPGRDGVDGLPGAAGRDGSDGLPGERGADGAPGRDGVDGKDGTPGERGPIGEQGERGEPGAPGRDGIDGVAGRDGVDGASGIVGERGPAGLLPTVKAWEDRVYYEGEVAVHGGATYQALRDTGRDPSHQDWQCIAAAGADGKDGLSFTIRGTFAQDADYLALDVVALNGASFVARRDSPGACPGTGWQMIAAQGKRGNPGEPGKAGAKGDRGEPGIPLVAASVDDDGLLVLTNGDGTTAECDLYPLLTKLAR